MDQYAFILGMITAFSECVAGGCKRMALSPPLTPALFARVSPEACEIVEKHGLIHYHERNEELPEEKRFEWLIIAARQETLEEYLALRAAGCSPASSLEPFYHLLSYQREQAVSTGYDAYRAYFPLKG